MSDVAFFRTPRGVVMDAAEWPVTLNISDELLRAGSEVLIEDANGDLTIKVLNGEAHYLASGYDYLSQSRKFAFKDGFIASN